uniref:Uncharacterized protein n=1 Tax=Strongyloides stercoralis TaxID=6248 RepID=A0AAF5DJA7_STRER
MDSTNNKNFNLDIKEITPPIPTKKFRKDDLDNNNTVEVESVFNKNEVSLDNNEKKYLFKKYVYEVCKLSYKKLDDANISKQGFSSYLINYASKKMLINIPLDARNLQATGTKYLSSYENDKNNKKKLNEPLSLKLSDLSENEMLKFSKILTLC